MGTGTIEVGVSTGSGRRKFKDVEVPVEDDALNLDRDDVGAGIVKVATVEVDASGGGSGETTAIVTLPANSVVLDVHVRVTESFDGDATQDLAVGVSGTPAKYLASSDFETGANNIDSGDEVFASGTPANAPASVAAGESIIATWTNTASASAGKANVSVVYYTEE